MARAVVILTSAGERNKASRWVEIAPAGTRIEFKPPKRTLPQNDRMWAMLTDIALCMKARGKDYSTDQWKVIFLHAMGKEVSFIPSLDGKTFIPWGQSSSDLGVKEMTDLIEFMFAWGAENGVQFKDTHPAKADRPPGQLPVDDGGASPSPSAPPSSL